MLGYRYDVAGERVTARFTDESRLALSTADIPTKTENAPIVGESSIHTLDDLKRRRPNEVAFLLAKRTLENQVKSIIGWPTMSMTICRPIHTRCSKTRYTRLYFGDFYTVSPSRSIRLPHCESAGGCICRLGFGIASY